MGYPRPVIAPLASVADVAVELGAPEPTDPRTRQQWTSWLRTTEALIRRRILDLDERLASGAIDPDVLIDICAAVVARHIRNPENLRVESVGNDDGVVRIDRGKDAPGRLQLTPGEWYLLDPPGPTRLTIQMTGDHTEAPRGDRGPYPVGITEDDWQRTRPDQPGWTQNERLWTTRENGI